MKQAPANTRFAAIAIDVPVFGLIDGELQVLVANVDRPPHYKNIDGFVGGLVEAHETAGQAVVRHLKEKAGLSGIYTEQLYTFSDVNRDKRNRVIAIAYLGLVRPDVVSTYQHPEAHFVPVSEITALAYDHNEMLIAAKKRLASKLEYTNIAQYVLPRHFTLTQLQSVYETLHKRDFDKRNFRKKILALDIVSETGQMEEGVKHRPAALYKFTSQTLQQIPLII
ncbi:MAG: NUDIX domain-containing protein [Patescibacteria group bacterium]